MCENKDYSLSKDYSQIFIRDIGTIEGQRGQQKQKGTNNHRRANRGGSRTGLRGGIIQN